MGFRSKTAVVVLCVSVVACGREESKESTVPPSETIILSEEEGADYERELEAIEDEPTGDSAYALGEVGASVTAPLPSLTIPAGPGSVVVGPGQATVGGSASIASGTVTVTAHTTATVPFSFATGWQYLTTIQGLRAHEIHVAGAAAGVVHAQLDATVYASADGWTATVSARGNGQVNAVASAMQFLGPLRRPFTLGAARGVGAASFSDDVTFVQSCNPQSQLIESGSGGAYFAASARITGAEFHGLLFPRLQGPGLSAIRARLAGWAVDFGNRKIQQFVTAETIKANAAYAAARSKVIAAALAKVPPGFGCRALTAVMPPPAAVTPPTATTPAPTPSPMPTPTLGSKADPQAACSCHEDGGMCFLDRSGQRIPVGAPTPNCASACIAAAPRYRCSY